MVKKLEFLIEMRPDNSGYEVYCERTELLSVSRDPKCIWTMNEYKEVYDRIIPYIPTWLNERSDKVPNGEYKIIFNFR